MKVRNYGDFFVTGDEWGLVEVVPTENRALVGASLPMSDLFPAMLAEPELENDE